MLLAACGRMPPGRIRSARVEERSSVRCSGSNGTLSQDTGAFSLTCTFAMLSFAVHEKEKEGDIACCLSSVHVRVGFDMFGSVIGGANRIESNHRIESSMFRLLAAGGWRPDLALSSPLSNIYLAYILLVLRPPRRHVKFKIPAHPTTPEAARSTCCRSTAVLFYQITHTSTPK